jgi:hypothetical protein
MFTRTSVGFGNWIIPLMYSWMRLNPTLAKRGKQRAGYRRLTADWTGKNVRLVKSHGRTLRKP